MTGTNYEKINYQFTAKKVSKTKSGIAMKSVHVITEMEAIAEINEKDSFKNSP